MKEALDWVDLEPTAAVLMLHSLLLTAYLIVTQSFTQLRFTQSWSHMGMARLVVRKSG